MGIYLKYEGTKSGAIAGQRHRDRQRRQHYHPVPRSRPGPSDPPATHLASGKQVVRPVVVTKEIDKASPLLINSCYTNEVSKTCTFTYTRTDTNGQTAAYLTVALKNAMITDFNHAADRGGTGVERLTFGFASFEFTWVTGGIMASVDMMAQT